MEKLQHSFIEVITAVLPMTAIIFLMQLALAPFSSDLMIGFIAGTFFMIFGMTLFLFGADFSMMEVGHRVGVYLMSKGKLWLIVFFGFLIGCVITIAEPDVQVLATQVFNVSGEVVPKLMLLIAVGIGVGVFMVIGLMRIIFQKNLVFILLIGYLLAFAIAGFFTSEQFFPVAFDAGGVTTGPLTVPFILAFASGATSTLRSKKKGNDSFGMVGLASLGPILAVLILGSMFNAKPVTESADNVIGEIKGFSLVLDGLGHMIVEVFLALLPVVVIFVLLQVFSLKLKKRQAGKIMMGFAVTYAGLVLFLQGVNIAFLPIGDFFGQTIAKMENNFILIPIGILMGFVVAFAEPAVRVMNKQVEEVSANSIKSKMLLIAISCGVAVAVGIAMLRILLHISLWWFLLPGYIIIFVLSRFVDPTFVAIAFDSGGVATGPMCSTFMLSFSMGVAKAVEGASPMRDGLGMVALVAMAPIISIMLLSFMYKNKTKQTE